MKVVLLILLGLSIILTIYIVYYFYEYGTCNAEGFESEEAKPANSLISIISTLKRVNGYLTDPKMWTDRLEMLKLSPVELARRELNKQKDAGDS